MLLSYNWKVSLRYLRILFCCEDVRLANSGPQFLAVMWSHFLSTSSVIPETTRNFHANVCRHHSWHIPAPSTPPQIATPCFLLLRPTNERLEYTNGQQCTSYKNRILTPHTSAISPGVNPLIYYSHNSPGSQPACNGFGESQMVISGDNPRN